MSSSWLSSHGNRAAHQSGGPSHASAWRQLAAGDDQHTKILRGGGAQFGSYRFGRGERRFPDLGPGGESARPSRPADVVTLDEPGSGSRKPALLDGEFRRGFQYRILSGDRRPPFAPEQRHFDYQRTAVRGGFQNLLRTRNSNNAILRCGPAPLSLPLSDCGPVRRLC